jgi:hypothetical protein
MTRIFWNNYTDTTEVAITPGMDVVSHIIEPMDENTYSFMIHTYDAKDNSSIPVEANGTVYGKMYERSLANRKVANAVHDENIGLKIEWNTARKEEIEVNLTYTASNGRVTNLRIANSETVTIIPNVRIGEPVLYTTKYRPILDAIDDFFAPQTRVLYYGDITEQVLKNAKSPFVRKTLAYGDPPEQYWTLADWTVNAAAAANGNFRTDNGWAVLWTWASPVPSTNMDNGKLWQTVELEAGAYRFDVHSGGGHVAAMDRVFIVAALGNDLPNRNNFDVSLDYMAHSLTLNTYRSVYFDISAKTTVSLGLVANLSGNMQAWITKVELFKQY